MIQTEIKVFEGLNTYYNENFKAPAHVKVYSKAPSYIKIEKRIKLKLWENIFSNF